MCDARLGDVMKLFLFVSVKSFCFDVAICDLVHDVNTKFYLRYLPTASGNPF